MQCNTTQQNAIRRESREHDATKHSATKLNKTQHYKTKHTKPSGIFQRKTIGGTKDFFFIKANLPAQFETQQNDDAKMKEITDHKPTEDTWQDKTFIN